MNFLDVVDPYYTEVNNSNELYIIIGVLSALAIILGVVAIIRNRKEK